MGARIEQIAELAQAVALQSQAIADGRVEIADIRAKVQLLHNNVETLLAWTDVDSSGEPWYVFGTLAKSDNEVMCTRCGGCKSATCEVTHSHPCTCNTPTEQSSPRRSLRPSRGF